MDGQEKILKRIDNLENALVEYLSALVHSDTSAALQYEWNTATDEEQTAMAIANENAVRDYFGEPYKSAQKKPGERLISVTLELPMCKKHGCNKAVLPPRTAYCSDKCGNADKQKKYRSKPRHGGIEPLKIPKP